MQEPPAKQSRENRFHAEDQGGVVGRGMLLGNHLEGKPQGNRKYSGIKYRRQEIQDICLAGTLEKCTSEQVQYSTKDKLTEGERERGDPSLGLCNDDHVHGPEERAYEHQYVSRLNLKNAASAEQEPTSDRQWDG